MCCTYLVMRLRSRKLGEPRRRGMEGDRERDELELLLLRERELCDPLLCSFTEPLLLLTLTHTSHHIIVLHCLQLT